MIKNLNKSHKILILVLIPLEILIKNINGIHYLLTNSLKKVPCSMSPRTGLDIYSFPYVFNSFFL